MSVLPHLRCQHSVLSSTKRNFVRADVPAFTLAFIRVLTIATCHGSCARFALALVFCPKSRDHRLRLRDSKHQLMSPFAINGEAAAAQRVRQPTPTGTHKVRISLRPPGTAGIKQLDAPVNLAGTRLFEGTGSTKRPPAIGGRAIKSARALGFASYSPYFG